MNAKILEFNSLLEIIPSFTLSFSAEELSYKPLAHKWSKKEILGHLVDSALNNLKRFSEVIVASEPYPIISYPQNELVVINQYQNMEIQDIISLFSLLNQQILLVISNYDEDTLSKSFAFPPSEQIESVAWWINDYVEHMKHHMTAIGKHEAFVNTYGS